MFASAAAPRRSPLSAAISAAFHGIAVIGCLWAAELRAFEPPRPPRATLTFVTVSASLPPITIAPAPVAAEAPSLRPALAVAAPTSVPVVVVASAVHAPDEAMRPLDAEAPAAAPAIAVLAPELRGVEAPPIAAAAPPVIAVGGFDRPTSARATAVAGGVVVGAGLQSARPSAAAPRAVDQVRSAGFDVIAAPPSPAPPPQPVPAIERLDAPVEIVFKPTPAYSDEARALRIQGEVVLEVEFTALREVHVVRVVRGLGHGLDENAARAASRILFTPARSAGRSVDVRTTVHIVFQLS